MRMVDVIIKKREGKALTRAEIDFFINGYIAGEVPDYQVSALLMAICLRGMDSRETSDLTMAIVGSGETLDLTGISGITADKHSTGGVGDKTSLVLCPMLAALGIKMAKMSGRGLGHTGGTIDKLESFDRLSCDIGMEQFMEILDTVGFAIAAQTADLAPADKLLYALRDVTGTVESRPLIVSSIMSKKIAAGADIIVLDVKCGRGSFMKTEEEASLLAREMVSVGKAAGRRTVAVITEMGEPLGRAVGNALEVKEAISLLRGDGEPDLLNLCLTLGSHILLSGGVSETEEIARESLMETIRSGSALRKLADMVAAQGGDPEQVYDTNLLPNAKFTVEAKSASAGFVREIAAEEIGNLCMRLGGGRLTKESNIDLSVGLVLHKKIGDYVNAGDSLATIHMNSRDAEKEAVSHLLSCYELSSSPAEKGSFIKGIVR